MSEMRRYQPGERVVYGANGICRIDEVKPISFSHDKPRTYYVLKPVSSQNSTLFVPVDSESATGKLRYVMSKEEIDEVLARARGGSLEWIDDKNDRAAYFHELEQKGIHEDVLLAIRCLYLRREELASSKKKLASADEAVLKSAEKAINEEFAFALGIDEDGVGEYIRAALAVE